MPKKYPFSFPSKIAGVTFDNDDGSSRQKYIKKYCQPGMDLLLIPESDNPQSPDSIGVWIVKPKSDPPENLQIGYLNRGVADKVNYHFYNGRNARAKILNVTGGGLLFKKTSGVNIEITIEQVKEDQ